MSERPQPSPERPAPPETLSAEALWRQLDSVAGRHAMAEVDAFTRDNLAEAGFAVYAGDPPHFSGMEHVNLESIKAGREHGILDSDEIERQMDGLAGERLLDPDVLEIKFRSDIALSLHSHPEYGEIRPDDAVLPSLADLETWHELATQNPGFTSAIATVDGSRLRVLFYRLEPGRTFIPYYQQHSDEEVLGRNAMLRLMRESGFEIAETHFDPEQGEWAPDAFDQLSRLWPH